MFVFEPGENNLSYLNQNVAAFSQVSVMTFSAVADTEGSIDFFLEDLTGQNNSLVEDYYLLDGNMKLAGIGVARRKVNVPVTTLDRFAETTLQGRAVSLVKIDVEGAENRVLAGAGGAIPARIPSRADGRDHAEQRGDSAPYVLAGLSRLPSGRLSDPSRTPITAATCFSCPARLRSSAFCGGNDRRACESAHAAGAWPAECSAGRYLPDGAEIRPPSSATHSLRASTRAVCSGPYHRRVPACRRYRHGRTEALYFGWHRAPLSGPPDWHANAFTGAMRPESPIAHGGRFPISMANLGDIKTVWEASRFDWALAFAQRIALGDVQMADRLNGWLTDWLDKNPPYLGPNWKCGQEASIRVLHLALAALIAGQTEDACAGLLDMIEMHLKRIAPTVSYAKAQDNNHGTSEAAALFIGGSWLLRHGRAHGKAWAAQGRDMLENRVARLVAGDGSFSQVFAQLPPPDARYALRSRHLAQAYCAAVILNLMAGARRSSRGALVDGVHRSRFRRLRPIWEPMTARNLLPLSDTDYRDYRPSVSNWPWRYSPATCAYADTTSECAAGMALEYRCRRRWRSRRKAACSTMAASALLHRSKTMALLRYPRFRFRPAQADALHVDFMAEW